MDEQRKSEPPEHLSDQAKRIWGEIVTEEYDSADLLIVQQLLESVDRRTQAREQIAATGGAVVKDRWGQLKPNPWIAIERDAGIAIQRAYRSLGFDQEPKNNQQGSFWA